MSESVNQADSSWSDESIALSPERASGVSTRADELYEAHRVSTYARADRLFGWLFIAQWVFGILVALLFSPYTWTGKTQNVHLHVYVAVFLGGVISSLPIYLAFTRPGQPVTRYVIAVAQMLWSALLIHLCGGRIEAHFHVFGSLAFLSFYRDWRVLVPATVVVAADHFIRGLYWPESVYGILFPEWWRFLEHAFWVVFEDIILIISCLAGVREMREMAHQRAELEDVSIREREKTVALDSALEELKRSQDALVRTEKLAALGQLAASVGHELRNPLAAVRNASTYIRKKVDGSADKRVPQMFDVIDRELTVSTKIISDLLDFARERPPARSPCPLHPLIEEAISVINRPEHVEVVNRVPTSLPVPEIDKDHIRQVFVNLIQNAVESIPPDRRGRVLVVAEGGGGQPWLISIEDNGAGMPEDVRARIFEPLFTTKTKGTGLGLAIVHGAVRRHNGTLEVESELGRGTRFRLGLPANVEVV